MAERIRRVGYLREVTDETFEQEVLHAQRPVLVDFWAAWCTPCHALVPELERLAEKYAGSIDVLTMDVEANPIFSSSLGVMTMPYLVFFRPGQTPTAANSVRVAEQIEAKFGLSEYETASS